MSAGDAQARILVVEDNDALRRGIAMALRESFGHVEEVANGSDAVARIGDLAADPFDVVVTDLRLPGVDGVSVLRAARERDALTSVLMMTAYGSVETAVDAMQQGAFDFVQKPLELEQIELRVARGVERRRQGRRVQGRGRDPRDARARQAVRIVGDSPSLHAAMELAERVAPTRSTVLVTGETGTGKELIARLIHVASPRAEHPFVQVNCAALPETLLESELFGHERGAFAGADRQRVGRFEQASGGTLFLDEVGDMSPATQAKLLRVLQDQQFHRLGGSEVLRTDARIVAATNLDLGATIASGGFREDLYFRLNVIPIHLPPLRERAEDLEALARHFIERFAVELDRPVTGFTEAALTRIRRLRWPGNVRQLQNAIERAVLMAQGERVDAADLDGCGEEAIPGALGDWRPALPPEGVSLRQVERELVLAALERTGYVQKEAARLLGVSRRKLNYMVQRMGITHAGWRRNRGDGPGDPGAAAR